MKHWPKLSAAALSSSQRPSTRIRDGCCRSPNSAAPGWRPTPTVRWGRTESSAPSPPPNRPTVSRFRPCLSQAHGCCARTWRSSPAHRSGPGSVPRLKICRCSARQQRLKVRLPETGIFRPVWSLSGSPPPARAISSSFPPGPATRRFPGSSPTLRPRHRSSRAGCSIASVPAGRWWRHCSLAFGVQLLRDRRGAFDLARFSLLIAGVFLLAIIALRIGLVLVPADCSHRADGALSPASRDRGVASRPPRNGPPPAVDARARRLSRHRIPHRARPAAASRHSETFNVACSRRTRPAGPCWPA